MSAGRPLKFKNVKELDKRVEEYFQYADKNNKPYTVTGLAIYLDVDRKTITNYESHEEYFPTIKRAKVRIENWLEENALMGGTNTTMTIFNLKNNFDWKDKQDIDANVNANIVIKVKKPGDL